MGLPRPDPFSVPDTPEQFLSDWLLHAGIGAGTVIGVYAYTGLYAGPGHAGIVYHALFSRAVVGSTVGGLQGSVALTDTMYAMSVYVEPFVAAARFVAPVVVPLTAAVALHYSVSGLSRSMGMYEMQTGVPVDFNVELRAAASR